MAKKFKFKVALWEYERGWGSKIDEIEEFDTYEEAVNRIEKFNADNTETTVPDWYMIAKPYNFNIEKNVNTKG